MPSSTTHAHRAAVWGAALVLFGVPASGPLALLVVARTRPQPPWSDAETFARSYHAIQALPYALGLVLVAGCVTLVVSLAAIEWARRPARAALALAFTSAFAAMVFFNYVVQTTFVPSLVAPYEPENAATIAAFSMACPTSLAWGLEMWGYGLLGVATWIVAPVFSGSAIERATRAAFVANGVTSVVGAVWTAARPGWVMTPAGLAAFGGWNLLFFAMALLALASLRRRLRATSAPSALEDAALALVTKRPRSAA